MSNLTLGLDLGSNSIGWALLDEAGQRVAAAGVRVFPEGVDRDQSGAEVPKNAARRTARGMRRQIRRRARRRRRLETVLMRAGLLPALERERTELHARDPYELRRGAIERKLTLHEIGRALVHMNHRRGFLSNRRADRKKKKEDKGILADMSQLAGEIEASGHGSLGKHLAHLHDDPHCRIRGRHTRRDMYEQEFAAIWSRQREHYPDVLTDALRDRVHKVIFYQRPLRIPKCVVGTCELEIGKPRCPKADRLAQRFRMVQEVNNLRVIDGRGDERNLTEDERCKLLAYLSKTKEAKFDQVRRHLGLLDGMRFNLEAAEREKMHGMPTDAALCKKGIFGKRWQEFGEDQKNDIVRSLLEQDEPTVLRRASEEWELAQEAAETLLDADLPDGYMSYSREAIAKLLPHMERGLPLMASDDEVSAMSEAGYLRRDQREIAERTELPKPPVLTNPIVRQALHEVRKVANAIVREYGKPAKIRIELAREAKSPAKEREKVSKEMAKRRRERQAAAETLQEAGQSPTRHFIERFLLWKEQGEICIYSGEPISLVQLLGGEVDVDHILPYSRSLDDSLANKVVCFRAVNAEKKDRTPWEWLGEREPERYERLLQSARRLPFNKRRKFEQKTLELDQFVQRQLNDTRYISRCVREYVQHLGADVVCTRGQLTAELRHQWGLNSVLDPAGGEKNRADHRHHAIDAIVIGLTDRSRLQLLARCRGREPVAGPWENLREQAQEVVGKIVVSHRVQRKVAGALHKKTLYGSTEAKGEYVYRKAIEDLTPSMIRDIRDETIRGIVTDRLKQFNIDVEGNPPGRVSPEVWKKPLLMPSGVPIKKVRVIERDGSIQPIRTGIGYVTPGSTHHVCIFEYVDEKGRTRRDGVFISTLEAVARIRQHEPVIQRVHPQRPDARFVMSLSANEMVLLKHSGREDLYTYETGACTSKQMWFRLHTAGGRAADKSGVVSKMPNTLDARKVMVDPLGRVRWAND